MVPAAGVTVDSIEPAIGERGFGSWRGRRLEERVVDGAVPG